MQNSDWAGLIIGTLSLIVSIVAAGYAVAAARRSDRILKRIVIYPYRELDGHYAELSSLERLALSEVVRKVNVQARFTRSELAAVSEHASDGDCAIDKLIELHWLENDGQMLRPNPDRIPYLKFMKESQYGQ